MHPGLAFFGASGLLVWWVILLFLTVVFGFSRYAEIQRLQELTYHESGYQHLPVRMSETGFGYFRLLIWVAFAAVTTVVAFGYRHQSQLQQELRVLGQEFNEGIRTLWNTLDHLPKPYKITSLLLLLLLMAARTYYLFYYPQESDETQSHMCFGSEGLVAAASYYPLPNNHILYNVISNLFHQVSSNFYWTTRAPTYLISLVGTVVLFAALLRFTSFTVALLAVGIFCFAPFGLYYSFIGRGYFLQAICASLGFLAVLGLGFRQTRQRLYWFVLLATNILGFYTIPTHAYAILPLMAILGLYSIGRRGTVALSGVIATGISTGVGCLLLYSPVVLISGKQMLLGNPYLETIPFSIFLVGFRSYFGPVLEVLVGQERVGLAAVLLVHAGLLVGLFLAGSGTWVRRYGPALLIMLVLPYGIMAVQLLYPPARTLTYLMFFLFMGAGILYVQLGRQLKVSDTWQFRGALVFILAYAGYQLYYLNHYARKTASVQQQVEATYAWLTQHHPKRVFVENGHYQFFFCFFNKQDQHIPHLSSTYQFGADYDYLVLDKTKPGLCPSSSWKRVYENQYVRVLAQDPTIAAGALVPTRQ